MDPDILAYFIYTQKDKPAEKNEAVTDTDTAVSCALIAVQTSGLTGAGEHD